MIPSNRIAATSGGFFLNGLRRVIGMADRNRPVARPENSVNLDILDICIDVLATLMAFPGNRARVHAGHEVETRPLVGLENLINMESGMAAAA